MDTSNETNALNNGWHSIPSIAGGEKARRE